MSGLLIINADDLGMDAATSDAILECFGARRIASASAMVWMSDSERAAALAIEAEIPLRLHLNLTEPFSDPGTPAEARRRQAELAEHFRRRPRSYWGCDPRLQSTIAACIEDQLGEFARLYGSPPLHLDGHRHVHTCLNVLLSRSLAKIATIRPTFTYAPAEKGALNRGYRRALNQVIWRRFASTRRFASIRSIDSSLGVADLKAKLTPARETTVEVMAHPGLPDERELLMSDEWSGLLAGLPLGSFEDLLEVPAPRL